MRFPDLSILTGSRDTGSFPGNRPPIPFHQRILKGGGLHEASHARGCGSRVGGRSGVCREAPSPTVGSDGDRHDHRNSSDDRGRRQHVHAGLQLERARDGAVLPAGYRVGRDGQLGCLALDSECRRPLRAVSRHGLHAGVLQPGDRNGNLGRSLHGRGGRRCGHGAGADGDPDLRQRQPHGGHRAFDRRRTDPSGARRPGRHGPRLRCVHRRGPLSGGQRRRLSVCDSGIRGRQPCRRRDLYPAAPVLDCVPGDDDGRPLQRELLCHDLQRDRVGQPFEHGRARLSR